MSRTSRIISSVSLGYVSIVITTLVGLWFTPFLLHHIGERNFGLWAVATPVLTYLGLADFGVIAILQRDVAFALGSADGDLTRADALPAIIGKTKRLVFLQVPPLCVAAVLGWSLIPRDWSGLRAPLAIVLFALVLCFPLRVYHAVLVGLQDLAFLARLSLASWAVGIVVGVTLVSLGHGLYGLAAAWASTQLVLCSTCYVRVRRRFPRVLAAAPPSLTREDALARLRKGFWVILTQVASMLLSGTDLLILGAILGPLAVVPYSITAKLAMIFSTLPEILFATAQPALSELKSSSQRGRLPQICSALTEAALLVGGLLACVVVAVNHGFVSWWVGEHEFAGTQIVLFLAVHMVLRTWSMASTYALFSFGYERRISITAIANGVVTLAASVILVKLLGRSGAPLAGIFGMLLVVVPSNLAALALETEAPVSALLRPLFGWAWRFVLAFGSLALLARAWTPRTFLTLAAMTIATCVAYGVIMQPLAFRGTLGIYVRPRAKALWASLAAR